MPPRPFEPVAVEFVTGAISSQSLGEVTQLTMARDRPLRELYIHDRPDGSMECSWNMTLLHGVRASLALKQTGDPDQARAAGNPELSPHLEFLDYAGNGYTTVWASPDALEAEFVCIPYPLERSETEDGGPLRYRVAHRVPLWKAGEPPKMTREVLEGDPGLAV